MMSHLAAEPAEARIGRRVRLRINSGESRPFIVCDLTD